MGKWHVAQFHSRAKFGVILDLELMELGQFKSGMQDLLADFTILGKYDEFNSPP